MGKGTKHIQVSIKISITLVLAGVTMLDDQKIYWLYKAEMSKLV